MWQEFFLKGGDHIFFPSFILDIILGWFLLRKFDFINFYMVSSCSILFPDFRTVFVFALRPFLPLSVKFSSSWIFYTLKTSQKYAKLTKWPKITFRGPIWVPRWSNWGFWGWFGSLKVVSEFWFGHPKCHFLYPQNGKNQANTIASTVCPSVARWPASEEGGDCCSLPATHQIDRRACPNISGTSWGLSIHCLRAIEYLPLQ